MPKQKQQAIPKVTLEAALAEDAYDYLMRYSPRLVDALMHEITHGRSPKDIQHLVSSNVGPERQALALRCYLAARWVAGEFEEYAE
jgi:hypothetical protein